MPLTVEKGPFIVISGHDLYDLKQILEQMQDKEINVYTYDEMCLPMPILNSKNTAISTLFPETLSE